jgi:hypothetical protein
MASCNSCGATVIFGGKRSGNYRFCSDKCMAAGKLLSAANQIQPDILERHVHDVHQGRCPRCAGHGPVDVHTSHRVWSALFLTSWKSTPQISCRACGLKSQAIGATSSLLLGWWGLPWGIIITPIQVLKNLVGMASHRKGQAPSPQLRQQVRLILASRLSQSE